MLLRWLLASLHLLALGIGLGAVVVRSRALRGPGLEARLRTVLLADTFWGLAALLWIATGLWRAFGGVEKGAAYYLGSTAFWIKMALLGGILALEIRPMTTLIRWRRALAGGVAPNLATAESLARTSLAQALLVVAMVFAATAMARGLGA